MSTKIEWTNLLPGYKGETWNPIVGCSKVSSGCDNCYAEKTAASGRLQQLERYQKVITNGKWNGKTEIALFQLQKPLHWKIPRLVFVCSMGDLFHESIPDWQIDEVIDKIALTQNQHVYIILTKRPVRMKKYFDSLNEKPLKNLWLGVTTEKQEQADKRIPILLKIPAAVRFISVEPMLGEINIFKVPKPSNPVRDSEGKFLRWIICGGESGPKARPMHPDWVRSLRDQCKEAGTPFFFKQWGQFQEGSNFFGGALKNEHEIVFNDGSHIKDNSIQLKETLNVMPVDEWNKLKPSIMAKVGKKKAGRLLDGVEHNGYPEINNKL